MEEKIAGFVLLVLGGLYVVRPDLVLRFQIWTQRVLMGADYIPGPRTAKIVRAVGVILVLLGLFAISGVLRETE